jgi:hypothetical protein
MTESTNALERLMSRQKPVVPARDDVVSEIKHQDIKTSRHQKLKISNPDHSPLPINPDEFETVRNTTRIECNIDRALRSVCQKHKITKETWFEAAYLYLAGQPDAMDEVIELASQRLSERKQIADHRRAVTMQKRLLQ